MSNLKDAPPPISPEQCRAARAVLRMTIEDVGVAALVAKNTVVRFEAGGKPHHRAVADSLRTVFEFRGIVFAADGLGLTWQPAAS